MLRTILTAAAFLAVSAAAPEARAQTSACATDIAKFCPAITPAKGGVLNCLRPHMSEVSAGCREMLELVDQRRRALTKQRQKARTMRGGMRTPPPTM